MNKKARKALSGYLAVRPESESDRLFLGQQGPLGTGGIQMQLAALGQAAGVGACQIWGQETREMDNGMLATGVCPRLGARKHPGHTLATVLDLTSL